MSWNSVLNMARPVDLTRRRLIFFLRQIQSARAPRPSTGATRNNASSSKWPPRNFRSALASTRARFRHFGIGKAQAALCFADDVGKIVLQWNGHGSAHAVGVAATRKSSIASRARSAIMAPAAATVTHLPVSFSIDVMVTLAIPHGVM